MNSVVLASVQTGNTTGGMKRDLQSDMQFIISQLLSIRNSTQSVGTQAIDLTPIQSLVIPQSSMYNTATLVDMTKTASSISDMIAQAMDV